jgi:serine/threonine-protein kinase
MSLPERPEEESSSAPIHSGTEDQVEKTNPTAVISSESLPKISNTEDGREEVLSRSALSEKRRVNLRNKIILGVVALSVLILGIVTAFALGGSNPKVPEAMNPATAGADNAAICDNFTKSSLGCEVKWVPNATEKRGTLINQSVAAGSSVEKDTAVELTYSSGPATSEMPNLKNKTVAEAEAALYEMNVSVSEIKEIPGADIPKGNVISSSVAAGTKVENGSNVVLSVSNGKAGVPNWADKTKEFVETDAKKLGLEVNFVYEESEKASDLVLSQTPAAGEVSSTDKVEVVLSKSFASKDIKVPDVIGKSAVSAQADLAAAGFRHIKTVTVTNAEVTSTQVTQVVPGVGQVGKSEENIVIIVSNPSK